MYTERQLVSFGNSLLRRYGVMEVNDNGTPIAEKFVTDAAVCAWKNKQRSTGGFTLSIDDDVWVQFGQNDTPKKAVILAKHEYSNAVKYDIQFVVYFPLELIRMEQKPNLDNCLTRVYNVESRHLTYHEWPDDTPGQPVSDTDADAALTA